MNISSKIADVRWTQGMLRTQLGFRDHKIGTVMFGTRALLSGKLPGEHAPCFTPGCHRPETRPPRPRQC